MELWHNRCVKAAGKRGPVIATVLKSNDNAEVEPLCDRYARVRGLTLALAAPLSDADSTIQSMPDASPAKWHLAHTTWFFETFLLRDRAPGYRGRNEDWAFLFNSYYEAEGPRIARFARGLLSRPALVDVLAWRAQVDEAMAGLIGRDAETDALIALGLAHEEQHQELLLTDIKHALWRNPLGPAMWPSEWRTPVEMPATGWWQHPGGIVGVGHDRPGFAFDCEGPVHEVLLRPFALAQALVTNGEWLAFMADGGYSSAALWLSDGWDRVRSDGWGAPMYWRERDGGWERFTLSGWQPVDPDAPVSHISFFEAEAFAAWAGSRLPTEQEWEALAASGDADSGRQLDAAGPVDPVAEGTPSLFGNCWQWTRSAYVPYPGFRAAEGAVGEYNGKFMSGQCVLRGGSCATPRGHMRASYRNFFQPEKRWQFSGLRLAKDI